MGGWARAVVAETTKVASLPSAWAAAGGGVAASGLLGYLTGLTGRGLHATADPVTHSQYLSGGLLALLYTQIAFVVLGALLAASEFPDQIGTTLTAVPRRGRLVAAKVTAVGLSSGGVAAVTVALSCLGCEAGLGGAGRWAWVDAGRLAAAVGYLTAITLISHAVGLMARRAVVPVVILVALTQAGSAALLNNGVTAARYLPDLAGAAAMIPGSQAAGLLAPALGAAVAAAWVLVLHLGAWGVLARREA